MKVVNIHYIYIAPLRAANSRIMYRKHMAVLSKNRCAKSPQRVGYRLNGRGWSLGFRVCRLFRAGWCGTLPH